MKSFRPPVAQAIFLAILVLFVAPATVDASETSAASFYNQGNAAFQSKDYSAAVDSYLKAQNEGGDDARLHYNLGAAYLKSGRLGPAVREFEAARLRAPRDADVLHNLEFARSKLVDELPPEDSSIVVRLANAPLRSFTENELAAAAAAFLLAAFLVAAVAWSARRARRGLSALGVAGLVFLVSIFAGGYTLAHHRAYGVPRAVVGASVLDVKSGPAMDNPTLFTVHEGLDCKIREVRGTWSLIEIPTGFSGWAPSETLLPIG